MIDFSASSTVFRGLYGPEHPVSDAAGGLRVVRFDHCEQCCPRRDRLHVGKEFLPASLFLLPIEGQRGEDGLLNGGGTVYDLSIVPAMNRSEFP